MMTGTSMSTLHVAGLFVALLSNRPQWNISMAKSAAITSAWSFAQNGIPGNEFMFGAGLMKLERALNPGLVYDESYENFEKYAKGEIEVDDLNLPTFAASFTVSHKSCPRTLSRTLTNIENTKVSYKGEVKVFFNSLDMNASIHVRPKFLQFSPNQKQKFELKISLTPRPLGYISALLIWKKTNSDHRVASPIHLYYRSCFDRRLWYPLKEAQATPEMGKEKMTSDDDDKGKAKMADERISGQKRPLSELLAS